MKAILLLFAILLFAVGGCSQNNGGKTNADAQLDLKLNKLTSDEEAVIVKKHTERPFTGIYNNFFESGTYTCKRCNAPLYRSKDKFKSECGWPSFDDEIAGAVKRIPDPDGLRTEIVCARCGGHLGHVFGGEGFTTKNTRHCVNSISLNFVPARTIGATRDTAIVAGGCFWGVEYYMQRAPGVISTEVGYIDGKGDNPTYRDVCSHETGYAEAVRVIFDPRKTTFEKVIKLFFEIHDPTQLDHQGPDYGDQYRSAVFYLNDEQKRISNRLIDILLADGLKVVTRVTPASRFWKAEEYHQDYYKKNNHEPYCHRYQKRF